MAASANVDRVRVLRDARHVNVLGKPVYWQSSAWHVPQAASGCDLVIYYVIQNNLVQPNFLAKSRSIWRIPYHIRHENCFKDVFIQLLIRDVCINSKCIVYLLHIVWLNIYKCVIIQWWINTVFSYNIKYNWKKLYTLFVKSLHGHHYLTHISYI